MHVSQENIEELFFDYFEGNLSDVDKTELLQFIHLHPEFEKDFAQWAQAYVPVEESVPDYGITASLLRKPPVLFSVKQWVLGGTLSLGLVVLLSVPFWKSSENEKRFILPITASPNVLPPTIAKKKEGIELKNPIKFSKTSKPVVRDPLTETTVITQTEEIVPSGEPLNTSFSSEPNSEKIVEKETVLEETSMPMVAKPDSLSPKVAKDEKQAVPFKKKKQKLPLNLKPSPDFMPVNDNF